MKLDYYFGISQRELSCDAAYYRSFIATCLRLCKISQSAGSELPATDRRPTDDAMILAIMAMHRYARDYGIEQDFKVVALLEHLLKQSKHNYEALLLAVQLYLDLGFGSLAMEYYSRLNIKNIQQGSMPWALMTRISLIHPLPIAEQQLQRKPSVLTKPLQEIHTALAWYESAEEKLMSFIQTSLDSELYHMVHHAISLRRKTMHGFNRHVLFLEGNRIARFASEQEQDMRRFDGLFRVFEDVSLSEDRDHSAFADYEFGEQRDKSAYRGKLTRPSPQLAWFKMLYEQCRCWGYMTRTTKDTAESLCALFGGSSNTDLVATANGFTTSEGKAFTEIGIITALALVDRSPSNTPEVAQVLEHIFISQVEGLKFLENTCIPTDEFSYACEHLLIYGWEWLSHRFLFIDTCHFIKVVSVMLIGEYINNAKAQELYLKALRLRLNVESASTVLEDQVLQVREKLVEDRELDRVIEWMVARMPSQETVNGKEAGYEKGAEDSEDSIGALLLDLMNEEDVRQAAKDLIESWAEALYGLAQVAKRLSADKPASGK